MKLFALIARAFMESRQRQAARIIREHSYLTRREARMTVDDMHVIALAASRAARATAPAEVKLAA